MVVLQVPECHVDSIPRNEKEIPDVEQRGCPGGERLWAGGWPGLGTTLPYCVQSAAEHSRRI
eukprot:3529715-Rhodomonas_salina.1